MIYHLTQEYKIYGPYVCRDNRVRILFEDIYKNLYTMSYPKYLMEKHLGRYLLDSEDVHHIDENTLNNEILNLEVITRLDHNRLHTKIHYGYLALCAWCNKLFELTDRQVAQRNKQCVKSSSGPYCSKKCTSKYANQFRIKIK